MCRGVDGRRWWWVVVWWWGGSVQGGEVWGGVAGWGQVGGSRRTQTEMDEISADGVSLAVKHAHRAGTGHAQALPALPTSTGPSPMIAAAAVAAGGDPGSATAIDGPSAAGGCGSHSCASSASELSVPLAGVRLRWCNKDPRQLQAKSASRPQSAASDGWSEECSIAAAAVT